MKNGRGHFLECHRPSENLGDGVEQVDLLVPLGELRGRVLHLERSLNQQSDDREQQIEIIGEWHAMILTWSDGEPPALRAGDHRDHRRAPRCVDGERRSAHA